MTDCPDLGPLRGVVTDILSSPTEDELLPGMLALRPRGAAWRTDEMADATDDSFQHRFWRAVCAPFADVYAAAFRIALQSSAITADESLPDWETDYGLPDCVAPDDFDRRKALLRWKIAAEPSASADHFVCLARALDYDVWVDVPRYFEFGTSSFDGGISGARFEFGYSAFGESLVTVTTSGRTDMLAPLPVTHFEFGWSCFGDRLLNFPRRPPKYFFVHIRGLTATPFEFGWSAFADPMVGMPDIPDLRCAVARDAPADSIPLFDFAG